LKDAKEMSLKTKNRSFEKQAQNLKTLSSMTLYKHARAKRIYWKNVWNKKVQIQRPIKFYF